MVSFDVPYEEVERVYIGDQDTFLPRVHPSPSPPGQYCSAQILLVEHRGYAYTGGS